MDHLAVDHGSGEISDVVNILFLMYIFFARLYMGKLHSEQNNSHTKSTSVLKILQDTFQYPFYIKCTLRYMCCSLMKDLRRQL